MEAPAEIEAAVTKPAMMVSAMTELMSAKPETVSTEAKTVTAEATMVEPTVMETATPSEADLLYVGLARSLSRRVAQCKRGRLCRCREQPR